MKKFFFCISLALTGLMASCVDKYEEVDAESKPSWLGSSIYAELKNPENNEKLTGTFTNYLRLVDDLGYAETLSRTGSKTVFPANDEAFQRFFGSNDWGVSSYEQLSDAQKKMLLYSSMLDNALLLGMLPNVSNGTAEPMKGYAVKHATNLSLIDTIQHVGGAAGMPKNNKYWTKFYNKGIDLVSDGTRPMMVHLTREYMLQNGISTLGDQSDFAILTGSPFTEGTAYIFNDRVVSGDITCQNGYIHQMEDVVVPPGNMAQVLRRNSETQIFSRILDYFSVPVYDENVTRNYNDWAMANGKQLKDSIYQMNYFSSRSNKSTARDNTALNQDPDGNPVPTNKILAYDPGWNQYFPKVANPGSVDYSIMDVGSFFVPEDAALKKYFLSGGSGAYLIDIYGDKPNTEENLVENLDSLHAKNPGVLTSFVKNLMKPSFVQSVPSKFETVLNDASEVMGLTVDMIKEKGNGKKDITIANNGVIYVINEVIAPDEMQSVMAPATVYPDMTVMNWAVQDGVANGDYLGMDFRYYLLAMKANYAFFIPEDNAFDLYYVDPASLGHVDPTDPTRKRPDVLHFYYDATKKPAVQVDRYYYNPETGEAYGDARPTTVNKNTAGNVSKQMVDILNYHTLVLSQGDVIGSNHYYQTKHGGTVYVDGNQIDGRAMSGNQYEGDPNFAAPRIKQIYQEKNGYAYRLDRIIQPPHQSVFSTLNETAIGVNEQNFDSKFSEFLSACLGFEGTLLTWAGISAEPKEAGMPSPQDAYTIFTRDYKLGSTSIENACLDYNVKMFNTFNYTLFAPDNAAMEKAYSQGLPRWDDVQALFEKYSELGDHDPSAAELADQQKAYSMIKAIRDFVRYHFVVNAVYADNTVQGGRYQTLSSDEMGVAKEVRISGGGGQLTVTDASGHSVTVNAADTQHTVNKMTRDYWFNTAKTSATTIETSSFCAVHEISEPLCRNTDGSFQ
jgi:uncharacterized surface protein with fasciclin (FAS1) repeats